MWTQWIARLSRQTPPDTGPRTSALPRVEVCPPALVAASHASVPIGLRTWLVSAWPRAGALPDGTASRRRLHRWPEQRALPLQVVRAEFSAALAGLDPAATGTARVQGQIGSARSLRELWHLRTDVYTLVARARGEHEAQRRLLPLDRHFPTRRHSPLPATRRTAGRGA